MPHLTRLIFHNCRDLTPDRLRHVVFSQLCSNIHIVEGSNFDRSAWLDEFRARPQQQQRRQGSSQQQRSRWDGAGTSASPGHPAGAGSSNGSTAAGSSSGNKALPGWFGEARSAPIAIPGSAPASSSAVSMPHAASASGVGPNAVAVATEEEAEAAILGQGWFPGGGLAHVDIHTAYMRQQELNRRALETQRQQEAQRRQMQKILWVSAQETDITAERSRRQALSLNAEQQGVTITVLPAVRWQDWFHGLLQ